MIALVLALVALALVALALVCAYIAQDDGLCDMYSARYDRATLALAVKGRGRRAYVATMRRDPRTGLFAGRSGSARPSRLVPGGDLAVATVIGVALGLAIMIVAIAHNAGDGIALAGMLPVVGMRERQISAHVASVLRREGVHAYDDRGPIYDESAREAWRSLYITHARSASERGPSDAWSTETDRARAQWIREQRAWIRGWTLCPSPAIMPDPRWARATQGR